MSSRKIKDAKDLSTNELIYFKSHAKATYMSDGTTVEDAINNIKIEDTDSVVTKSDLDLKQDIITDLDTIRSGAALGLTSVLASQLATVATSGNYNDLSNKPTIPTAVTESTVSGWGFTKNTGTYSKPSGGIPKTDLASAVQTSLGKADTALLSYTELYKGTITGVSANGTSVATSGVANIPAASTSAYGVTKLSSSTSSTSTTLAATASAVKSAYDLANGKQAKLVSGTNIKTINGESILGSGDITISGGTDTKEIVEITGTSCIIEEFMPNKIYVHTSPTYDIDIWEYITTDAAVDEYITYFKTGTTSFGGGWTPYYSFPDGTLWANGVYPKTEPNTLYELSIVKTTINGVDYFKAVLTPFKPVE